MAAPYFTGYEVVTDKHQAKHLENPGASGLRPHSGAEGSKWRIYDLQKMQEYVKTEIIPKISQPVIPPSTISVRDIVADLQEKYGKGLFIPADKKHDAFVMEITIDVGNRCLTILHCYPTVSDKLKLGIGTSLSATNLCKF